MVLKMELRMDFINGKEKTIASDSENIERYKLKILSRIRKITGVEKCYSREEQNPKQMPME